MANKILREKIDAGEVDFSDMALGKWLPPVTPGEILLEEFLRPTDPVHCRTFIPIGRD